MELVRGLCNLRPRHRGCVATIGNFDGVHLGHQAVLSQLNEARQRTGLPLAVIVFEPQPQEHFRPDSAPPRLTRWREKFELLRGQGVDRLICLRFDAEFASLSAAAFVEQVLVHRCGVRCLVVGDDFRFGTGRAGDFSLLEAMSAEYGFSVVRAATFRVDGERVSSTRVRRALAEGDLEGARRLLGRYYGISGRVGHGDKRGRTLGFATANIEIHRRGAPVTGIFVARVFGLAAGGLPAVAYVGRRPIVQGERDGLEVHVFDFDRDCYGRRVRVELIQKLRDDQNFDSFDALKRQIAIDAANAREVLNHVQRSAEGVV